MEYKKRAKDKKKKNAHFPDTLPKTSFKRRLILFKNFMLNNNKKEKNIDWYGRRKQVLQWVSIISKEQCTKRTKSKFRLTQCPVSKAKYEAHNGEQHLNL